MQPQARIAQHSLAANQPNHTASTPPAGAQLPTVDPPQPKTITLEPLGYVEKADGQVEAIISLGDRVHVVHEGEIVEDNFRVAKIASSAVELVDNSVPSVAPQVLAETEQRGAQAPAGKALPVPFGSVSDVVSNTNKSRQFAADSAAGRSQPSKPQELGYVERADGRVEAILADGELVRLSQANKSFAKEFHGPITSPANVEVAKALPPAVNPPESLALEPHPLQADSFTPRADEAPPVALEPEPSTAGNLQGIPASNGESETGLPGIVQPEPLADYSGNRFEANMPQTLVPALPAVEPSEPSARRGNPSAVIPLGFVEKAGGEEEAIVEVLDQVYLVHEGELFAEKYRALRVTPSSAEIVEESKEGSALPPDLGQDSEAVHPPVFWWRGPPAPTGSSGTDPPIGIGKTKEFAACKPVARPSKPPPERPVESCQGSKGVQTPRASPEGIRGAEGTAQTATRAPPRALNTVGFVEKASGETQAIVADAADVYLVPTSEAALGNPKISNLLPGLQISSPVIRALAFPGPVLGVPTTTFETESPQTRR